jgi:hypothetical protein
MRVLIDIRKKSLEAYPYKSTKLGKLFIPKISEDQVDTKLWSDFGIDDGYFGGNIHGIVEVKGKPFYIIYNQHLETLGILHKFDNLNYYTKEELKSLCEMQNIKYEKESKDELIERLTLLKS